MIYDNPLFCQFLVYCGQSFGDMRYDSLEVFAIQQWPIVERALVNGEGIRACDERAHDLTCSFVSRKLYEVA